MTRKFGFGASLGALVIAAMAPWSASQAHGVSVRVSTPEFGIRIGAPHRPAFYPPVFVPPPPVIWAPQPVFVPRPVFHGVPRHVHGHGHRWQHRQHQWRHHRHHGQHRHHQRHRGRD